MVHGNWYSARYEIYLTKPLDLYNDILPICSSIRYMLKYIQMGKDGIDGYKLIIIDTDKLDKRFTTRPIANDYACALDTIEYSYKTVTREKDPTMFEYQDVFTYANKIKHQNQEDNLFIPQIQPIIANPEYYNKIISMEQELTNIELTQEELDLIKAVETHPSLAGLIKFSGFNLANGYY
jgi:hypothetical protein